jgi:DNA-directed RNA polymerase specialized sigma subunit
MTKLLSLDLPDTFADALANSHESKDLHMAAAAALMAWVKRTPYTKPDLTKRDAEIVERVLQKHETRANVAKAYNLSEIRIHQIIAKHKKGQTYI